MKKRYVYLVERVNGANYVPVVATVSKSQAMAHARGLEMHGAHIIVSRMVDGVPATSAIMWDSEALDLVG